MHWKTSLGKNIEYQNHLYKIVGETNDFHFEDFQRPVPPLLLMGCKPADVNYVYVKTSTGLLSTGHAAVDKIWKNVNPNLPFEYHYLDTVFDGYFNGFVQVSQVMSAASLIMIVISISGIFGLALIITGRKMKEISIRKVLGAGIGNIVYLINREFLLAVSLAVLIGMPLSYWLNGNLLLLLSEESVVSFTPIVLSFFSLLLMIVISVSWHIFKAHTANPTMYLKDE